MSILQITRLSHKLGLFVHPRFCILFDRCCLTLVHSFQCHTLNTARCGLAQTSCILVAGSHKNKEIFSYFCSQLFHDIITSASLLMMKFCIDFGICNLKCRELQQS
ncbi:hypothetical protein KC19_2G205800 [Ceratodon purpureus]|uniref:Uncharacterized protein n=1 Tax=Ceratodon purpureus TaxID=3225 RepID=A0A8T0IZ92_CERPU|nr:hypothetical protein KC19_2G205800 [Ceratodon purpureus]